MTRETRDKSSSVVANWKCLSACTLVSMASFQYGLDFTMIGGFQAMIGFLQVIDVHILSAYIRKETSM